MAFVGVSELRCRPQLIMADSTDGIPMPVTADVDIVPLYGDIDNNNITVLTIQATMDVAGNYYLVDGNGKKHYLTNPNSVWPANQWFLATYFVKKGSEHTLRFSASGNLTGLIVGTGAGVY